MVLVSRTLRTKLPDQTSDPKFSSPRAMAQQSPILVQSDPGYSPVQADVLINSATNLISRNRRNRAHISTELAEQQKFHENSHLSVNRSWAHLLFCSSANQEQQPATNGKITVEERPTAVVVGAAKQPERVGGGEEPTFVRAMTIPHCQHTDWEALREFRVQEMDEIRQRAAHMENTMRWWLISAEQWREKWLAMRGERNRLREENARLRSAVTQARFKLRGFQDKKDATCEARAEIIPFEAEGGGMQIRRRNSF